MIGKAELGRKVVRRGVPKVVARLQGDAAEFLPGRAKDGVIDLKALVAQGGEILPAHTHIESEIGHYLPIVLEIGGGIVGAEVTLRERGASGGRICVNRLVDGRIVGECPKALHGINGPLLPGEIVVVLFETHLRAHAHDVGTPGMGDHIAYFVGILRKYCGCCAGPVCAILNGPWQGLDIDIRDAEVNRSAGVFHAVLCEAGAVAAGFIEPVWRERMDVDGRGGGVERLERGIGLRA